MVEDRVHPCLMDEDLASSADHQVQEVVSLVDRLGLKASSLVDHLGP